MEQVLSYSEDKDLTLYLKFREILIVYLRSFLKVSYKHCPIHIVYIDNMNRNLLRFSKFSLVRMSEVSFRFHRSLL